ncbi:MAG: sulfite exporter TauE/SafE family protein [Flavobacteriales bacterium]|nr:sulfite exporter TauE/SafE family protein [Flavobacteriales bacterium]
MIYILSAITIGIVGSLHCVGMCGPLVLALHQSRANGSGEMLHHVGRLSVYMTMGLVAGTIGTSFNMMGLQQSFSMIAGILLVGSALIVFFKHYIGRLESLIGRVSIKLASYANGKQQKSPMKHYVLGVANGLLPCGVVYLALVGAANTFTPWDGAVFMLAFGLGTVPALWVLSAFGRKIPLQLRNKFRALVPVVVILVGALLIVRGMDLGIPYLSPQNDIVNSADAVCNP